MKIAPRGRAVRNLAEHGVDMKMVMGNRACRNIYRKQWDVLLVGWDWS